MPGVTQYPVSGGVGTPAGADNYRGLQVPDTGQWPGEGVGVGGWGQGGQLGRGRVALLTEEQSLDLAGAPLPWAGCTCTLIGKLRQHLAICITMSTS